MANAVFLLNFLSRLAALVVDGAMHPAVLGLYQGAADDEDVFLQNSG